MMSSYYNNCSLMKNWSLSFEAYSGNDNLFFISNVTARNKNIWSNVKQLFLNKVINKLDHRQIISYMYQWNKILTTYKGEDMFDLKIVNYFTLSPLKLGDLKWRVKTFKVDVSRLLCSSLAVGEKWQNRYTVFGLFAFWSLIRNFC